MKKRKEVFIGEKLKLLRKSHGYTQEQLSEAIDCTTRYIGNIEQNKSKPSYEVLIRICNLFHTSPDAIFNEYIERTEKKIQNIGLEGFEDLKLEEQEVILHLIEYFNKNSKK